MCSLTFTFPGAVIRKLKVGLYKCGGGLSLSRNHHWRTEGPRQYARSAFYFFTFLLFYFFQAYYEGLEPVFENPVVLVLRVRNEDENLRAVGQTRAQAHALVVGQ